jgi:hypothetical protein
MQVNMLKRYLFMNAELLKEPAACDVAKLACTGTVFIAKTNEAPMKGSLGSRRIIHH